VLALAGISAAGCTVVFVFHSGAVQNAAGILSCAGIGAVIVRRLNAASDVVDAALHLAEEIARLGGEIPGGSESQEREGPHLAVVRSLPGQRAAVGQDAEPAWYEDRQ
jgi:hypothetical protein